MFPLEEVEIRVDFWINEAGVGAIMDLPGEGGSLRLAEVRFDSPRVHFEQAGAHGHEEEANRVYDGDLVGETIFGETVQSGESVPFILTRLKAHQETVALEPGLNSLLFEYGGLTRRVLVRLPEAFQRDVAYPVVFYFSGSLGTAEGFLGMQARSHVTTEEFIAVFPDPYWPMWDECPLPEPPGGTCEEVKRRHGAQDAPVPDDIGFTEAILDWLVAKASVDEARVYATGQSAGGFISNELGLHTDRFAAIAPMAGTFWRGQTAASVVSPLSVLMIFGKRDVLHEGMSEGVVVSVSALDSLALWAGYNRCNPTPVADTSQPGITIYRHEDCDDSTEVLLYAVHEGGHWAAWTPSGRRLDPPGDLFELVWGFFQGGSETLTAIGPTGTPIPTPPLPAAILWPR